MSTTCKGAHPNICTGFHSKRRWHSLNPDVDHRSDTHQNHRI